MSTNRDESRYHGLTQVHPSWGLGDTWGPGELITWPHMSVHFKHYYKILLVLFMTWLPNIQAWSAQVIRYCLGLGWSNATAPLPSVSLCSHGKWKPGASNVASAHATKWVKCRDYWSEYFNLPPRLCVCVCLWREGFLVIKHVNEFPI